MANGGKNAYLQQRAAEREVFMRAVEHTTEQYMTDMLEITLHEEFGFGYDRIMSLVEKWEANMRKYRPALNSKHAEADVYQEHMDRIMVQILRGRPLLPFEERYPDLRKVKY